MQFCVQDESIKAIRNAVEKTYIAKGQHIVDMNFKAIDMSVENLFEVDYPKEITADHSIVQHVKDHKGNEGSHLKFDPMMETTIEPVIFNHGADLKVRCCACPSTVKPCLLWQL